MVSWPRGEATRCKRVRRRFKSDGDLHDKLRALTMSILDKVKELGQEIEHMVEGEAAKVESAATTDWKALALEAHDFLKAIPQRFAGDAVYDYAQTFVKKIEAAL
jgi:hypothetical protein